MSSTLSNNSASKEANDMKPDWFEILILVLGFVILMIWLWKK